MSEAWRSVRAAAIAGMVYAAFEAFGASVFPGPLDPTPTMLAMLVSVVGTGLLLATCAFIWCWASPKYAAAWTVVLWSAVWGPHNARIAGWHRVGWFPTVALAGVAPFAPGFTVAVGALGGITSGLVRSRGGREGFNPLARDSIRSGSSPDLLLITVDTVRSDAQLLNEGRWKVDTPFSPMQGWTHFTQAIASAPWTLPSMHSLMSSLPVREHGGGLPTAVGESRRVPEAVPFPYVLQQSGYETWAVVSNPHLSVEHGFADGFDHWVHSDRAAEPLLLIHQWSKWQERITGRVSELRHTRDDRIVEHALEVLGQPSDRPKFVWVHLLSPHEYTRDPASSVEGWSAGVRVPEVLQASYAANIDKTRLNVQRLASAASSWVVAVTSDHGESLGEDGRWGHGRKLSDVQLHVPLAIRRPNTQGGVDDELVAVSDLGHTMLAMAGAARQFPGQNLLAPRSEPVEVGGVRGDGGQFAARNAAGKYMVRKQGVVGPGVRVSDDSMERLESIGYID
jgi:arylsulfatase A-like enzyme